MFPSLGGQELFIILFLALLLFGAKRLPEVGSGLGKGIRAFKEAIRGAEVKEELAKTETPSEGEKVAKSSQTASANSTSSDSNKA